MQEIEQLRVEYRLKRLDREDLHPSPFIQFLVWFEEARESQILEPNAMFIATASKEAHPSSRVVLMKGFDERGLLFFTSYEGRKAQELEQNPFASSTFWWKELERQVTLEGRVEKSTEEETEAYFARRPRKSQLAAWASHQGQMLASRAILEEAYQRLEKEFEGKAVPPPSQWGGFRLIPHRFEFWQGRENRLHDRFQYVLEQGEWRIERLSP